MSEQQPGKKPYTPPRIVPYGHVKDVVQGGGGKKSDATGTPPGGNSKACWIAEQLYGAEDPRTWLLRAWLHGVYERRERGWRLVALYRRFGRRAADLIARGRLPRRAFHLLFDRLLPHALTASFDAVAARRPGA